MLFRVVVSCLLCVAVVVLFRVVVFSAWCGLTVYFMFVCLLCVGVVLFLLCGSVVRCVVVVVVCVVSVFLMCSCFGLHAVCVGLLLFLLCGCVVCCCCGCVGLYCLGVLCCLGLVCFVYVMCVPAV